MVNRRKTIKNRRRTNRRKTKNNRKYYKRKNLAGGGPEDEFRRSKRKSIDEEEIYAVLNDEDLRKLRQQKKAKDDVEKAEAKKEELSEDKFQELHSELPTGRSKRGECSNTFIPKDVVPGKAGYNASMPQVPFSRISEFVETQIEEGPQLVTLPVGGMSHIILVDVMPDKIMISDWRGRKFIDGENPEYKNYKELISELNRKYRRPVEFYFIDPVFLNEAEEKSISLGNRGGCSQYAYAWSELYYKKGYYEWPFTEPPHPNFVPNYPYLNLLYVKSKRYKGY